MFILKKLLTLLVLPPGGPLLLALCGLMLLQRKPRLGRGLAFAGVLSLYALSTPIVGTRLLENFQPYPPINTTQLGQAQAIVVLCGGTYNDAPEYGGDTVAAFSLERGRYGARLARKTGLPVLIAGGTVAKGRAESISLKAVLEEEFRVPVRWVETESRDTRENARNSARILKAAGITHIALVSQAWHLPRAVPLFEAAGLQVAPAPTVFVKAPEALPWSLLPSVGALRSSYYFFHEWLGLHLG
jgi:uncharacterized SAM-binding protein YcdF (DUF218 family)